MREQRKILHKFQVHGVYYWTSIILVVLIGVPRFAWVISTFLQAPDDEVVPLEIYFWLLLGSVFPVAIHVIAGVAEVDLNRHRLRVYRDRNF